MALLAALLNPPAIVFTACPADALAAPPAGTWSDPRTQTEHRLHADFPALGLAQTHSAFVLCELTPGTHEVLH